MAFRELFIHKAVLSLGEISSVLYFLFVGNIHVASLVLSLGCVWGGTSYTCLGSWNLDGGNDICPA